MRSFRLTAFEAVVANRRRLGQDELKVAKRVFGKRSLEVSKPIGDPLVQGRRAPRPCRTRRRTPGGSCSRSASAYR